jgi:hypothetical protein
MKKFLLTSILLGIIPVAAISQPSEATLCIPNNISNCTPPNSTILNVEAESVKTTSCMSGAIKVTINTNLGPNFNFNGAMITITTNKSKSIEINNPTTNNNGQFIGTVSGLTAGTYTVTTTMTLPSSNGPFTCIYTCNNVIVTTRSCFTLLCCCR